VSISVVLVWNVGMAVANRLMAMHMAVRFTRHLIVQMIVVPVIVRTGGQCPRSQGFWVPIP
jgi:hypothetical protein